MGSHADEVADQAVAHAGVAGGLAHGYALDNVALQASAGDDVAVLVGNGSIVVHVFKTQATVGKESFHPSPVGLE